MTLELSQARQNASVSLHRLLVGELVPHQSPRALGDALQIGRLQGADDGGCDALGWGLHTTWILSFLPPVIAYLLQYLLPSLHRLLVGELALHQNPRAVGGAFEVWIFQGADYVGYDALG